MLSGHQLVPDVAIYKQSQNVSVHANRVTNINAVESIFADEESGVRFMIVRNPFDRLVSAFRDTLEKVALQEVCNDGFCVARKEMVGLYRQSAIDKFGKDYFKTFLRENHIYTNTFRGHKGITLLEQEFPNLRPKPPKLRNMQFQ